MVLLQLFYEFFKTGLFAIGGGMATLPFLQSIGETTNWYTYTELMNMLAVSESTPGPIGINMSTYVGYIVAGIPGAVIATFGEITPSIIVILIVATILQKFRKNSYVEKSFYGLRPASTGLIAAACISVSFEVFTTIYVASGASIINQYSVSNMSQIMRLDRILLSLVIFIATNYIRLTKKLHPIVFILICAVVGVVFQFA